MLALHYQRGNVMANEGRHIYCNRCAKQVGVIRDASLLKGLNYICPYCATIDTDNHTEWLNTTTQNKGDYILPGQQAFNDLIHKICSPK